MKTLRLPRTSEQLNNLGRRCEGEAKQSFSLNSFDHMSTNDKPILIDDGTLDYVVQLPSGRQERFNREYVLDTYGDCCYATLAQQLAEEIDD